MSFKKRAVSMDWEWLEEYDTQDVEFAKEVRQMLSKVLGFEPNLKASYHSEMRLRNALKRNKSGELADHKLQLQLNSACIVVNEAVFRQVPDQAHLVDLKKLDDHFGGRDAWINE